jgi:hypothetical protein
MIAPDIQNFGLGGILVLLFIKELFVFLKDRKNGKEDIQQIVLRILQEIHTDITKINAKLNELIHRE